MADPTTQSVVVRVVDLGSTLHLLPSHSVPSLVAAPGVDKGVAEIKEKKGCVEGLTADRCGR